MIKSIEEIIESWDRHVKMLGLLAAFDGQETPESLFVPATPRILREQFRIHVSKILRELADGMEGEWNGRPSNHLRALAKEIEKYP